MKYHGLSDDPNQVSVGEMAWEARSELKRQRQPEWDCPTTLAVAYGHQPMKHLVNIHGGRAFNRGCLGDCVARRPCLCYPTVSLVKAM